jgi:hypothetical protein
MAQDVIGPSSPKQEMMLNTETDVAIWGGEIKDLAPPR